MLSLSAAVACAVMGAANARADEPTLAELVSFEHRGLAALGYLSSRQRGAEDARLRLAEDLVPGVAPAGAPWDDPSAEQLSTFQLGVSLEAYVHVGVGWEHGDDDDVAFAMLTMPLAADFGPKWIRNQRGSR